MLSYFQIQTDFFSYFWKITAYSFSHNVEKQVVQKCAIPIIKVLKILAYEWLYTIFLNYWIWNFIKTDFFSRDMKLCFLNLLLRNNVKKFPPGNPGFPRFPTQLIKKYERKRKWAMWIFHGVLRRNVSFLKCCWISAAENWLC